MLSMYHSALITVAPKSSAHHHALTFGVLDRQQLVKRSVVEPPNMLQELLSWGNQCWNEGSEEWVGKVDRMEGSKKPSSARGFLKPFLGIELSVELLIFQAEVLSLSKSYLVMAWLADLRYQVHKLSTFLF